MQGPFDAPPAATPVAASSPADPFVAALRHVRCCIRELESSCACCGTRDQQPQQQLKQHYSRVSGCCCRAGQQQVLRGRMRSTLSLLKLLLQVDFIGYRLQLQLCRHFPSTSAAAPEAAAAGYFLENYHDVPRASGCISEGQAFLLAFARHRCLRCLLAVRLWLQEEQQQQHQQEENQDAAAALGRGDFAESASHLQQQLYISGGPQAKAGFYHMDWPYALASQQPQQRQQQLLLGAAATADEGAAAAAAVCPAILEVDRKAAGCLYTSIWRRLRAGRLKAAETLAAAKGASWLIEVLRGTEAWLEAYGSEGFFLPGGGGLCDAQELEFLSDASGLLRSALWPSGLTLKDLLIENSSNNSNRKRPAAGQGLSALAEREVEGDSSICASDSCNGDSKNRSDLLAGADASILGRQGEGKTQRGLLQYTCNLILQSSSNSSTNSSSSSSSSTEYNRSSKFGLCGSHYSTTVEEAGIYGYIAGDLSALCGVAETWGDAAFAVCHSLHEELAASLVGMLRGQEPCGLFDGEIAAVSAAPAAAAAGAPLPMPSAIPEEQRFNSLQQPQHQQQQSAEESYQSAGRDVLLLLRRFSTAVGKAAGGQAEGLLRAAAGSEAGAADALQDAAAIDRAISALLFRVLLELPLISRGLCSSSSSARIAAEHRDDFRMLQVHLIAAYMAMPFAWVPSPDDGHLSAAPEGVATAQESHALALLHQLERIVGRGAAVYCTPSHGEMPALSCSGMNPEVQRFAALLVCALRDVGQQQQQQQAWHEAELLALRPHSLFSISAENCDGLLGQYLLDALDGQGVLDFPLTRVAQQLTPQRRTSILGEILWRRSAAWGNAADERLDEFVAWACNSFPADVLAVVAKVAELLWETAVEVLPGLKAASPSDNEEQTARHLDEERLLRGVGFLLQLLLSVFGLFYLEPAMRHRAALPLLRVARTPQPSLVAAAAGAAASVSSDSDNTTNKEQQYALCLLGCYCLSICCYAAFIGIAVEVAAARRAAVRRVAAAALPAAVAVSATTAAADVTAVVSGSKQAKSSCRRSVSQWLQHAVLPGLVVPLVVESLAFCKSSSGCSSSRCTKLNSSTGGPDDRDNTVTPEECAGTGSSSNSGSPSPSTSDNPFARNPSLLLAAPLATSLAESLRYLRQEQMQLQTESHRLPLLPLQQFAALEAFGLLLKAMAREAPGNSNGLPPGEPAGASQQQHLGQPAAELLQTFLSERRSFYFPLMQDQRHHQQQRIAAAAELEQQLQLQQLAQRLETLGQQQSADSREPMSLQCQRQQHQAALLRALQQEEEQQELQQQELQQHFYMPIWCEGGGFPDNEAADDAPAAAEAAAALLPSTRSRLLADFVFCATEACADDLYGPNCSSSSSSAPLCALLSTIGCNASFHRVVSDDEAAELLLLAILQGTRI